MMRFVPLIILTSLSFVTNAFAEPVVNGNTISWPDDGWYQIQNQSTYESLCEGGSYCTVPDGVYIIINHSTGERYNNVGVPKPNSQNKDYPARVISTGQTVSVRFGDDASYHIGVSAQGDRYRNNGDGSFTDSLTGITWLGVRDCIARRDWNGAIDYANQMEGSGGICPGLTDGSIAGDWRLPTIKELQSISDYSQSFPVWGDVPYSGIWPNTGNPDVDNPWDRYWSSTSFYAVPELNAWSMSAEFGQVEIRGKDYNDYAWPVRR